MTDNILSAICRASVAVSRDRFSASLAGVHLRAAGDVVRCEATDGKILAVCYAHASGITLPENATICAEHLPRVTSLLSRNRRALSDIACMRDPVKPGRALVEVRELPGDAPKTRLLEFSIPRLDDACRVRLLSTVYPDVRGQEKKGKVWKIGLGGNHFDIRYLSMIPKIIPGTFLPYHTDKSRTVWRSQSTADYVLVMPIAVPDSDKIDLFSEEVVA